MTDDTPKSVRNLGLLEFALKLAGLACLTVAAFTFGEPAGVAAAGASCLAAAYLP